jgi:hypothetical protein
LVHTYRADQWASCKATHNPTSDEGSAHADSDASARVSSTSNAGFGGIIAGESQPELALESESESESAE